MRYLLKPYEADEIPVYLDGPEPQTGDWVIVAGKAWMLGQRILIPGQRLGTHAGRDNLDGVTFLVKLAPLADHEVESLGRRV